MGVECVLSRRVLRYRLVELCGFVSPGLGYPKKFLFLWTFHMPCWTSGHLFLLVGDRGNGEKFSTHSVHSPTVFSTWTITRDLSPISNLSLPEDVVELLEGALLFYRPSSYTNPDFGLSRIPFLEDFPSVMLFLEFLIAMFCIFREGLQPSGNFVFTFPFRQYVS